MSETVMDLIQQFRNDIKIKPCKELGYCPYGPMVEDFPHLMEENIWRCAVFGHQCPVTIIAEPFMDEGE